MHVPHVRQGQWPSEISPARMAAIIRRDAPDGCAVALLGIPDDLGVRLNGGRPGARNGPTAFRAALSRYGVAQPAGWDWPVVFDAGDIVPASGEGEAALMQTHDRVTEAVRALLAMGLFPVGIGGGHDLTYAFARAAIEHEAAHGRDLDAGLYFDAHLDVRDTVGSGMPFRRLVERCGVKVLRTVGLSPFVNAREHVEWFEAHGGLRIGASRRTVEAELSMGRSWFASFDMDVLAAGVAPGVSAPNPVGISARRAARLVRSVAGHPAVKCLDFMEFNPEFDPAGRTGRVLAHLFLEALRGLASRERGV